MFVNRLRQRLSRYSVFNLAQSRYGTDQALLTFQTFRLPSSNRTTVRITTSAFTGMPLAMRS
jgi:hypothetical protein